MIWCWEWDSAAPTSNMRSQLNTTLGLGWYKYSSNEFCVSSLSEEFLNIFTSYQCVWKSIKSLLDISNGRFLLLSTIFFMSQSFIILCFSFSGWQLGENETNRVRKIVQKRVSFWCNFNMQFQPSLRITMPKISSWSDQRRHECIKVSLQWEIRSSINPRIIHLSATSGRMENFFVNACLSLSIAALLGCIFGHVIIRQKHGLWIICLYTQHLFQL